MLEKIIAGAIGLVMIVLVIASFISMDLFQQMWVQAFTVIVLIGIIYLFASLFFKK